MYHEKEFPSAVLENLSAIHIWLFHRVLLLPIHLHRVWTARIAIATISINKCCLLLSILGAVKVPKWLKKQAFNKCVGFDTPIVFCWAVKVEVNPFAIDRT
jgi:hypothetical protein